MIGKSLLLLTLLGQDDPATREALARFRKDYSRSANPIARATAVAELARTGNSKTLGMLAQLLVSGDPAVRVATAKAIGDNYKRENGKATRVLLATLSSNAKYPNVRIAIFEALGKLRAKPALPAVCRFFREKDYRVARAAIAAAGETRCAETLGPLKDLMGHLVRNIRRKQAGGYKGPKGGGSEKDKLKRLNELLKEVMKAFQTITGDPWTTPQEWEVWFRRHGSSFRVGK